VALGLGRNLRFGYHGQWWSEADLAQLGTMQDAKLAARLGRSVAAVRVMRTGLGIPTRTRLSPPERLSEN
jgi:hypothetical protein